MKYAATAKIEKGRNQVEEKYYVFDIDENLEEEKRIKKAKSLTKKKLWSFKGCKLLELNVNRVVNIPA